MYRIVDESKGKKTVDVAIELAREIAANSPDTIIATRDGLMAGEDGIGSVEAGRAFQEKMATDCEYGGIAWRELRRLIRGENKGGRTVSCSHTTTKYSLS